MTRPEGGARSMTGFGQAAVETAGYRLTLTLRAVNHRFLDLAIRLRDEHRHLEPRLRELLGDFLHRGRVDVRLDVEPTCYEPPAVGVDEAVVAAVHAVAQDLVKRGLVTSEVQFGDLLALPQVLTIERRSTRWSEEEDRALDGVIRRAAVELVRARRTEGVQLQRALSERVEALSDLVAAIRPAVERAPRQIAEQLRARLSELDADLVLDPDRLAHEAALLAERADVVEELDRLAAHLEHFREVLERSGPIGKRLDFLAQEILRELNTLGTKSRDGDVVARVVDAKVLLRAAPRAGAECRMRRWWFGGSSWWCRHPPSGQE